AGSRLEIRMRSAGSSLVAHAILRAASTLVWTLQGAGMSAGQLDGKASDEKSHSPRDLRMTAVLRYNKSSNRDWEGVDLSEIAFLIRNPWNWWYCEDRMSRGRWKPATIWHFASRVPNRAGLSFDRVSPG